MTQSKKRPVCNLRRALYVISTEACKIRSAPTQESAASVTAPKRYIYLLKRALFVFKRALHILQKGLNMGPEYSEQRAMRNLKQKDSEIVQRVPPYHTVTWLYIHIISWLDYVCHVNNAITLRDKQVDSKIVQRVLKRALLVFKRALHILQKGLNMGPEYSEQRAMRNFKQKQKDSKIVQRVPPHQKWCISLLKRALYFGKHSRKRPLYEL